MCVIAPGMHRPSIWYRFISWAISAVSVSPSRCLFIFLWCCTSIVSSLLIFTFCVVIRIVCIHNLLQRWGGGQRVREGMTQTNTQIRINTQNNWGGIFQESWSGESMARRGQFNKFPYLFVVDVSLRRKYVHLWWTTLSWHTNASSKKQGGEANTRDEEFSIQISCAMGVGTLILCVCVVSSLFLDNIVCAMCTLHVKCLKFIGILFGFDTIDSYWNDIHHICTVTIKRQYNTFHSEVVKWNGTYTFQVLILWLRFVSSYEPFTPYWTH